MGLASLTRVMFNTMQASEERHRKEQMELLMMRRGWCTQDPILCTTNRKMVTAFSFFSLNFVVHVNFFPFLFVVSAVMLDW